MGVVVAAGIGLASPGCGGRPAPPPAVVPARGDDTFTTPGYADLADIEARFARHGWAVATPPLLPGPYRITPGSLRTPTIPGRGATYRTRTSGKLGPPQMILSDLPGYDQMLVVAETQSGSPAPIVFKRVSKQ